MNTQTKKQTTVIALLVALVASFAIGATLLVSSAFADNTDASNAQTCTATASITATFDDDGNITIPNTELKNDTDYVVTVKSITTSSDTYSIIKDWTNDFTENTTIKPGESLVVAWSANTQVPAGFDGTTKVKVGTITYTYSYEIPEISGTVTIEGTPEVGETLNANVIGLPADVKAENLAFQWYEVADDGTKTAIDGATSQTYKVADEYAGKKLTCEVSDKTGYYKGSLEAEPVTIKDKLLGSVTITQDDVVVTEAEAETLLTATLSDDVQKDANPTYAWYVSEDGENFILIEGATEATFTPDATYVDKYIMVKVTSETYSGVLASTNKVKITPTKIAFVVLSGDDNAGYNMYFGKRLQSEVPTEGGTFKINNTESVTAAKVYSKLDTVAAGEASHDFENTVYAWDDETELPNTPWAEQCGSIKTATVVDAGIKPKSAAWWFGECTALTSVSGLDKLNTIALTNTSDMFEYCTGLTSLNLAGFNTSTVQNMKEMFYGCTKMSEFDLSVLNMNSATDMSGMFFGCTSLTGVTFPEKLDSSNVTDMNSMFKYCTKLSSVDLTQFNTSKVTDMSSMFEECWKLTSADFSAFDTSNVTNMSAMFADCYKAPQSVFNTVREWNTGSVTDMSGMFYCCASNSEISFDLSKWNTENVENMSYMFAGCNNLSEAKLTNFDTSKVTDFTAMFQSCNKKLTSLDISSFDVTSATGSYNEKPDAHLYYGGLSFMFAECELLQTITLGEKFDVSNATNLCNMFHNCQSLTEISGIENWNTSKVKYMSDTLSSCFNLTADLSKWDVSSVSDHYDFAHGCTKEKVIEPSNWDTK